MHRLPWLRTSKLFGNNVWIMTGWPQSRRKIPKFSRLLQVPKTTFPSVIATKSKRNNDPHMSRVIPHQLQQYNRSPTHCDHLLNSRDFVHLKPKTLCYTHIWWTENISFVKNFPRLHRIRWEFSEFSMFVEILEVFQVCGHHEWISFNMKKKACELINTQRN